MHCEFRDDTKLRGAVDTLIGRGPLWGDVDVLEKWAITNHMKFLTRATARFSSWDGVILVKNTNWGMRAGGQPCGIRSQRWVSGKLNMSQQCLPTLKIVLSF